MTLREGYTQRRAALLKKYPEVSEEELARMEQWYRDHRAAIARWYALTKRLRITLAQQEAHDDLT